MTTEARMPPGQYVSRGWPVLHYGPLPKFDPVAWDLRILGAAPRHMRFSWRDLCALPHIDVRADLHCVTKFSVLDRAWRGVSTATLLEAAPPAPGVTHVMVWADFGYSTNMSLADFSAATSLFATRYDDRPLPAERGFPVRLVVPHLYAWKGPKWVR